METWSQDSDSDLLAWYRNHLTSQLLPFWKRAVDPVRGGVFTCFDNRGTTLVSRDKYTWSQGRFIWIWSRLARFCQDGLIEDSADSYLEQALDTVNFLWDHAILPNGNCAYLLSEEGVPKESIKGQGYDTSFYADCFVILGFSEFARVSGNQSVLERALQLYDRVMHRVQNDVLRSEPYPIPAGLQAHSVPMILLNVTQELYDTLVAMDHPREAELKQTCEYYAEKILETFRLSDGRIAEMVQHRPGSAADTLLLRHVNPGHTLEDMWFIMHAAKQLAHPEWIDLAAESIKKAFELGWDETYGGLLRFVDGDGGMPQGRHTEDPYEKLILETWDTKLWWPHSEALYVTLLSERLTGDATFLRLYQQVHEYAFQTFPNSDVETGEWIQIRDREGQPVDKIVALPVKDPYHIIRNALLIIELLSNPNRFREGVGHEQN